MAKKKQKSLPSEDIEAAREVYEKSIQVTTRDVAEFMGLIDFDASPEVQDRVNLTTLGASEITPWSSDLTVTIEPEGIFPSFFGRRHFFLIIIFCELK